MSHLKQHVGLMVVAILLACDARNSVDDQTASRTTQEAMEVAADRIREADVKRYEQQLRRSFDRLDQAAANATSITLYEIANPLDSDYQSVLAAASEKVLIYPVKTRTAIGGKQAGALIGTLVDRGTYLPYGEAWSCLFRPHHVLEVKGPEGATTVVICIECGDVQFAENGEVTVAGSVRPAGNAELEQRIADLIRARGKTHKSAA